MDDKRVTVDQELREKVLDPIVERHDVSMLDLVYMFTALALEKNLDPFPPRKRLTLSGDVFEELPVYRLVKEEKNADEPRRVAHELANAGMLYVLPRLREDAELVDIFELRSIQVD